MKKLWMIMGLAVGLACQGEGAAPQLPADAANWSVVKLVKGGRDALAAGDRIKARALADAAVARDSGYADAWKLMGMVRLQNGETNAATQAFRTALLIAPGDAASNLELAWLVWHEDQGKALSSLDMVMQSNLPDRDELIHRILALLAETGQDAKAIELYKQWKPTYTMGELGVSLFYDGRRAAASPFLETAWMADEERPLVGLYLAAADAQKGRRDRVSTCLKAYLEKAPAALPKEEAETLWTALAGAANDANMKEVWSQVERRYPADPDRRTALAKRFEAAATAVRRRGDLELACEFYRQVSALDPDRPTWAEWILLDERLSGEAHARQCVASLLPRVTVPVVREGVSAREAHYRGDIKAAIKGYRNSLAAKPGQLALRFFLVRALLAEGETHEAHQEIVAADALKGDLIWRDRMDMAEFWFEVGEVAHALELNPNILVEKSRALAVANDWEGALRMASLAATNQPSSAEAWKQTGIVQARLLHYPEAQAALEKSLAITNDVVALQELGWVLWTMGDRKGARTAWDQAITRGVKDRDRMVAQIVGRMMEDGEKDMAFDCLARWLPGMTALEAGLNFFRMGRMKAAEPFMERAWAAGDKQPYTGFALARIRAINGVYAGTPDYLASYIASSIATASVADVMAALDTVRLCSGMPGVGETLEAAAKALSARPEVATAVTDVYVALARDDFDREKWAPSLAYFEKALGRDPNLMVWPVAWNLAVQIPDLPRGIALLGNLQAKATSRAVRAGVEAKLAEVRGDLGLAKTWYRDSLNMMAGQPDIHGYLFDVCLKLGDLDQARREAEWMEARFNESQFRTREALPLALMWADLGEDSKALDVWQFLHLAIPDMPYYGIELAMAQYRKGRGAEAVETLGEIIQRTPTRLAYESQVQVLTALGRLTNAVDCAVKGLAAYPSPSLRRSVAELREAMEGAHAATSVLAAAQACLPDDPGSVPMALMVGRALALAGQDNEALDWHETLLQRNPDFVPGLVFLRDQEIRMEKPRRAIPYAERLRDVQPWDDMAVRHYAMNLAEADGFSRAIRILKPMAGQESDKTMAILRYENTTPFDYAGMNTVSQMVSHVSALVKAGFVFVNSIPGASSRKKAVMMVLVDPESDVVEALEPALQANGACAVIMVRPDNLRHSIPRKLSPARLAELKQSGRWTVGVTFPEMAAATVRADGVKGNPLTHRVMVDGALEPLESMTNRIGAMLASASSAIGAEGPRWFYYPKGDYGQVSLDTDRAAVNLLSNQVGRLFTAAFFNDDSGFASLRADPLHLPAKAVPAAWDAAALINYLEQANPVVMARLELAKLFYWHGQSEEALYWFRKAKDAGADPFEIAFNEAANAAMEGDIPVALKLSREAVELAPQDDPRPAQLLEKATNMRRPTARLRGQAWWDNENRSYWEAQGSAEGPVRDWLRWNAGVSRHHWDMTDVGTEEGSRADLGFLAYIAPEVWLQAGLQEWLMDSLPDLDGWQARLHVPNHWFRGNVELTTEREMMETVEALRKGVTAHREGIEAYSRVVDFWDCYLNGAVTDRSDGNSTWWAYARIIRRLKETPYLGVGYAGSFADSTDKVPEYWSPQELQQHQVYAAWQATGIKWNGQLSGQVGYAQERNTTWRYVWGGRAVAVYKFTPRVSAGGDVTHQGGPVYDRTTVDAFMNFRW